MPSRLPAAAAALPVAGVRNGDHGNGDGPSDDGSSDSDDEVKTVDISPETDLSPPFDLPGIFKELVGLSSTDAWADKATAASSKGIGVVANDFLPSTSPLHLFLVFFP